MRELSIDGELIGLYTICFIKYIKLKLRLHVNYKLLIITVYSS